MWLRAPARRCLRLTTLLFGRELMLSFLHKTKATGFYLWGESGFCEMQKTSAPGQERTRLAGQKGIRLLSAPVVGGAGTALLAAPACHCLSSTTCLSLSHACAPCAEAVMGGKAPWASGQRKGAYEHSHIGVEAEAGPHLSCGGIQTGDPATVPASRDTSDSDRGTYRDVGLWPSPISL